MQQKHFAVLCIAVTVFFSACSRKTIPEDPGRPTVTYNGKTLENNNSPAAAKPVVKRTVIKRTTALPVPKVIMVNDKVAKKNIDGRLYYDVEGHRYWRNYNDGKYYLYSRAMYSDSAFKPH
jgi:hypothetical protein